MKNGDSYDGKWKDNVRLDGYGIFKWKNGDYYCGINQKH